ncbi:hypothetical protein D3C78_302400 [compost metagenome]
MKLLLMTRCLVPDFDGEIFSRKWKEALWDKFYTAAPQRHRRSSCQEALQELPHWLLPYRYR